MEPKVSPKLHDMIWFDLVIFDLIWFDLVIFDLVIFDLIWFGLIWFDLIWFVSFWILVIWSDIIKKFVIVVFCLLDIADIWVFPLVFFNFNISRRRSVIMPDRRILFLLTELELPSFSPAPRTSLWCHMTCSATRWPAWSTSWAWINLLLIIFALEQLFR